jgi:hypothetical protein
VKNFPSAATASHASIRHATWGRRAGIQNPNWQILRFCRDSQNKALRPMRKAPGTLRKFLMIANELNCAPSGCAGVSDRFQRNQCR